MGRGQTTVTDTGLAIRHTRLRHVERFGWAVCAIALVLGVAGLNSGNNILYLATAWILATIIASGQISRRALRGLRIRVHPPLEIWAREPGYLQIRLQNGSRYWPLLSIEIFLEWTDLGPGRPVRRWRSPGYRLQRAVLMPGQYRRVFLHVEFPRRGRYRLRRIYIGSNGPFGWFYRWGWIDLDIEVPVLPPRWPNWQHTWEQWTAAHLHPRRSWHAHADEFYSLRTYQSGDPFHWIHWPSSARTGTLQVRQWHRPLQDQVWIVFDRRLPADLYETVLSWMCTALSTWQRQGRRVVLTTQGWGTRTLHARTDVIRALVWLAVSTPVATPVDGLPWTDAAGFWLSSERYPPPGEPWIWIRAETLDAETRIHDGVTVSV